MPCDMQGFFYLSDQSHDKRSTQYLKSVVQN